ncbi:MAG: head maturation protease, ClpP-related [Gemmatimonadota bacterium]
MDNVRKLAAAQWLGAVTADAARALGAVPVMKVDIRAQAGEDEAEILIYDDIGEGLFRDGVTATGVIEELGTIQASTIHVRINSMGGQVFEGLAIFNALERHDARIVTHVDGIAASIASVIALAGDEVEMAKNALYMIHDPRGGVLGTATDMREMADILDKVAGSIAGVYARKTGASTDQVREWMQAETFFDADEAKDAGFVDTVTEARGEDADDGDGDDEPEARAQLTAVTLDADALDARLEAMRAAAGAPADEGESAPTGPDPDVAAVFVESQRLLSEAIP